MNAMGLIGREVVRQRKAQELTVQLEAGELKMEDVLERLKTVEGELAQQRHLTTYTSTLTPPPTLR